MNEKVLPKPVDWDELYPGRFLKSGDFKGKQVTLTISEVKIEELVGDKGPQIKGVISFDKTEKQFALNKTNGLCLKAMFGRKVQEWVGKRVTLFPSQWNGESCIRVFGSPDIDGDVEIPITLPRRRPFNMTMHKVTAGKQRKGNVGNGESDAELEGRVEAMIRESEDTDALETAWASAKALFKGSEIPMTVDAAYTEMREHFDN
jgi:hypothetical protein